MHTAQAVAWHQTYTMTYIRIRLSMRAPGPPRPLVRTNPSIAAVAAERENLDMSAQADVCNNMATP